MLNIICLPWVIDENNSWVSAYLWNASDSAVRYR